MIPGNNLEDNRCMSTDPLIREEYLLEKGEVISLSSPRLSAIEKLYVRVYLSTLSHNRAHEACTPGLKHPKEDNPFSRKESVQFHISLGLQDKADAIGITSDLIIEKLYKEATREGAGSNHAARIQALTQLGKHLGLFQDKKEKETHTFNIISYTSDPIKIEEIKENQIKEVSMLPEGIVLTEYPS